MTDRELLEMAAKAAGIFVGSDARVIGAHPGLWFYTDARQHPACRQPNRPGNVPWNPLTDDGDALRLAVALRLQITPGTYNAEEATAYRAGTGEASERLHYQQDMSAATRRAIVRAAAEIGESMP